MCDGSLIPDVMHDILEGMLQYEVKLLLQYFVNFENYLTLETLNSKVENVELGGVESKNRPTAYITEDFKLSWEFLKTKWFVTFLLIYF